MTDLLDLPLTFLDEISEFQTWVDAKFAQIDESSLIKTPLYHYTTAAGVKGILDDCALRFTSIFHVNDPSELSYGLSFVDEYLKPLIDANDRTAIFFGTVLKSAFSAHRRRADHYIASFSLEGNELSQWRAYADDGRGYSLGFSPKVFERHAIPDLGAISFFERQIVMAVDYSENSIRTRQSEAVQRVIDIFSKPAVQIAANASTLDQHRLFYTEIAIRLHSLLLTYAIGAKHAAYHTEREVRLVLVAENSEAAGHLSTRARGAVLVPFINCPLTPSICEPGTLTDIWVGPAASQATAEHGLRQLLRAKKLEDPRKDAFQINFSKIPYRSL